MEAHVTLYTRHGCHLCDEARDVLTRHGLVPEECDIDLDPGLIARFGTCVPAVMIDGQLRFRGKINETLLRRLLLGRERR